MGDGQLPNGACVLAMAVTAARVERETRESIEAESRRTAWSRRCPLSTNTARTTLCDARQPTYSSGAPPQPPHCAAPAPGVAPLSSSPYGFSLLLRSPAPSGGRAEPLGAFPITT